MRYGFIRQVTAKIPNVSLNDVDFLTYRTLNVYNGLPLLDVVVKISKHGGLSSLSTGMWPGFIEFVGVYIGGYTGINSALIFQQKRR